MIFTKGEATPVTLKQCQLILGEPLHTKKLLHVSFGMGFTTMLPTTYKNVIVVKDLSFCCLHGVDGYHHLIVCIDYFTEWLEAKPIRDKTGLTVATFLYEFMCRHGCFKVQVNDQGREFVNRVSTCLREPTLLTGVEQSITSAYHPQSNGLVERQNRKIKNALVKVLDAHPEEWSHIIEGVLFACRVS